jgi:hypothetical protein
MAEVTITPTGRPAWARTARIGDYGGSVDKEDSETEGTVPTAWVWYQEFTAMLGDAFRQDRDGNVHSLKLALARSETARTRASEKIVANSEPDTSDERLGGWVELLRIPVRFTDTKADIRIRAAAKRRAVKGPTITNEDDAIAELLGDNLIEIFRQTGASLSVPPTQTFWPTVTPGPASHDLGDGAWLSERAHLVVSVRRSSDIDQSEFLYLMNTQLFDLLNRMLPAWATFNWAVEVASGFVLDVSQLDFGGFNP